MGVKHRLFRLFIIVFALIILAGCSNVSVSKSPFATPGSSTAENVYPPTELVATVWKEEMLTLVNLVRAKNGVGRVDLCSALNNVAQRYAEEMQQTGNFSHTGIDGSTIGERATSGEYLWQGVSENIAMGYADVKTVMQGWIDSPGHFKNLISTNMKHVGFGLATSPIQSQNYWVQNFGFGGIC